VISVVEKGESMQKRISIVLVLLACLCLPVFASAETIVLKSGKTMEEIVEKQGKVNDLVDHKDIFEARLTDLFNPNTTDPEKERAGDKLLQFAKDYPNSRFAPDAKYLVELISFYGAIGNKDKEAALKYLKNMEEFINLYPNGSLDEFTCEKWEEMLGKDAFGLVYIPFKYILTYLRGDMGFEFKDYQSVIDNFSLLKDNLDFSKDKSGRLAENIYVPLALSYKLTNRLDKLNEVAKEAVEIFPNTNLGISMQKVLDKNKP
jgi:hypothetical protein